MQYDRRYETKIDIALPVTTISSDTTTVGNVLDAEDYHSLLFTIKANTIINGEYQLIVEHSGDINFIEDVTSIPVDLDGSPTLTNNLVITSANQDGFSDFVAVLGTKQYVRVSIVSTNVQDSGVMGVEAIFMDKAHQNTGVA